MYNQNKRGIENKLKKCFKQTLSMHIGPKNDTIILVGEEHILPVYDLLVDRGLSPSIYRYDHIIITPMESIKVSARILAGGRFV